MDDPRAATMSLPALMAWVGQTLSLLVEDAGAIHVAATEGRRVVIFEVQVAPRDLARVVGRGGSTVEAIRTLLAKAAGRSDRRYLLQICEGPGSAVA